MDKEIHLELTELLENYKRTVNSIDLILMAYRKEWSNLIERIKGEAFENTQGYFDQINLMQRNISIAKYKYDFTLSEKLDKLVSEFDRDDEYSRKYWYAKFHEENFSLFD